MKMNEKQYQIVKYFLNEMKTDPRILARKWNNYWKKVGSDTRIELVEVYRVFLTINYEVYAKDPIPEEDIMLAMEGLK